MEAPTTSIDPLTGDVNISWIAPYDGGDPITAYNIYVGDSTYSVFSLETTSCTTNSNTLTNHFC